MWGVERGGTSLNLCSVGVACFQKVVESSVSRSPPLLYALLDRDCAFSLACQKRNLKGHFTRFHISEGLHSTFFMLWWLFLCSPERPLLNHLHSKPVWTTLEKQERSTLDQCKHWSDFASSARSLNLARKSTTVTDRPVFHLLFKRWIKKIAAYTFLCSVNKTRLRNKEHRLGVCMFSVMYHVLPRRTPLQHGAARVTSLRVPQVFIPASPSLINNALPSRSRSLLPITFETVSTPLLVHCWQSLWHICRVVWREYRLYRNKPLCRSVSPSLSLALHSRECVCVSLISEGWQLEFRLCSVSAIEWQL